MTKNIIRTDNKEEFHIRLSRELKLHDKKRITIYCKVDKKTVQKWRSGESYPNISNILSLGFLLHKSIDWLVVGGHKEIIFNRNIELQRFMYHIRNLNQKKRFQLTNLLYNNITVLNDIYNLPSKDNQLKLSYLNIKETTIGERIQNKLDSKKTSIYEISLACNVSERTVYNWINNKTEPRLNYLEALSNCLNESINWTCYGYHNASEFLGLSLTNFNALNEAINKFPPSNVRALITILININVSAQ